MKDLFEAKEYKAYLLARLKESRRGELSSMARALGCQSSFLSHVLKGEAHLTPDHAARLAQHWQLDGLSTEYLLALVMLARSGSKTLSDHLRQKLGELRTKHRELSSSFSRFSEVSDEGARIKYYSCWYYAAIHVALLVQRLHTSKALAQRLDLPEALVAEVLEQLQQMGLVRRAGSHWSCTANHLHLDRKSSLAFTYHNVWRQRGMHRYFDDRSRPYFYSGILALSQEDLTELQRRIREFLAETQAFVNASAAEELICLNLDIFAV